MPPQLENQFLKLQSCFKPINAREAGLARVLKWMIADSGSVITDVITLKNYGPHNLDVQQRWQ